MCVANLVFLTLRRKCSDPFSSRNLPQTKLVTWIVYWNANFLVKNEESSKQIVEMMKSQDLSLEFKLLTVAAFRNSCVHNRDLTKQLLLNCENTMIGAKIMEPWMYEATKNLEYLATTVTDEKRWFHALTAPFLVIGMSQGTLALFGDRKEGTAY